MPYPHPPITLDEKLDIVRRLARSGATINELNAVRKRLSLLKGGGLVKLCKARKILALILSDVINDNLQVIASGATVQNMDPPNLASQVISRIIPDYEIPTSIRQVLSSTIPTTPAVDEDIFRRVSNYIIGNNQVALEAAAKEAQNLNLKPLILTAELCGEARLIGMQITHVVRCLCRLLTMKNEAELKSDAGYIGIQRFLSLVGVKEGKVQGLLDLICKGFEERGLCLLFGGETTVVVRGNGVGGRNQEMALACAIKLDECSDLKEVNGKVAILCAGTDGIDGPCDAAGAVVDTTTVHSGRREDLHAIDALARNNSYSYFDNVAEGRYHIVTGHTGTNVMDLVIVTILK